MKAIVTGANGFLGAALIDRLVKGGVEVMALDLSFANRKFGDSPLIETIECSAIEIEKLDADALAGKVDLFYHLAWRGVNGPEKASPIVQLENGEMTLRCAEFAKRIGVKKFLCAGTIAERAVESLPHLSSVSGGMMYGTAKHATRLMLETYAKNVGLPMVWMQFSNIYGPRNKTGNLISYTLTELAADREASFGPAAQPYDFVFVDDLIEAVYRLGTMETKESFYFIGSGKPRVLKEYLYLVGETVGKREKILIGVRGDDGVRYTTDMFCTDPLVRDVGEYVSGDFEELIRFTAENF